MATEIIFALISGGVLLVGAWFWLKADHLVLHGKRTTGFVFANRTKHFYPKENTALHFPVVRFITESGEWITQELDVGFNPPLEEKSEIRLIYDPDEPTYVMTSSFFHLTILPRVLVIIGLAGLILSLLAHLGYLGI